jgi:hypothetical protein
MDEKRKNRDILESYYFVLCSSSFYAYQRISMLKLGHSVNRDGIPPHHDG